MVETGRSIPPPFPPPRWWVFWSASLRYGAPWCDLVFLPGSNKARDLFRRNSSGTCVPAGVSVAVELGIT